MNYLEKYPELAYVYRGDDKSELSDLRKFVEGFFEVFAGNGKKNFRTKSLAEDYRAYMQSGGASYDVQRQMNGSVRAFVKNIFPYDALMPPDSNLVHLCLFSLEGALDSQEINKMIESEYPGMSAFIFVQGETIRSVNDIWHAHVVGYLNIRT